MSKEQNKFGHLIGEATKTPRTDKAVFVANLSYEVVDADFARQLETELAAAIAELRELKKKINEKKEMNSDRIEEIQKTTAYPESHSTLALAKVWNERAQENNKQINEMREIIKAAAFMAGKNWLHVQVALVEYLARGRGENVKWLLSEYAKFKESEE